MKEVSSAPNKDVNVRGMETTAANSESEQGDQLNQRAVRYSTTGIVHADVTFTRSMVMVKVTGLLNFRRLRITAHF